MKHFRIGAPDALREVEIAPVFYGCATAQGEKQGEENGCGGLMGE